MVQEGGKRPRGHLVLRHHLRSSPPLPSRLAPNLPPPPRARTSSGRRLLRRRHASNGDAGENATGSMGVG
jgi:hypothetical protein